MSAGIQKICLGALALFAASLPAGLAAQDKSAADPLNSLRACRAITAEADRLACFDKAAAALVEAADEGDLSVVDREQVRKTRRSLFGFALPDLGIFGGDKAKDKDAADEIEILNTTVASARSTSDGLVITTAEGAKWLVANPPRRLKMPRAGQALEFRRGTLSSYFIRIDGQSGVKGRRIG